MGVSPVPLIQNLRIELKGEYSDDVAQGSCISLFMVYK